MKIQCPNSHYLCLELILVKMTRDMAFVVGLYINSVANFNHLAAVAMVPAFIVLCFQTDSVGFIKDVAGILFVSDPDIIMATFIEDNNLQFVANFDRPYADLATFAVAATIIG